MMKSFSLLSTALLFLNHFQPTSALSSGFLSYCDLSNMNYFGAGSPNRVMTWVKAPVSAAFYTLRSGDSSTVADDTTYTPGVSNVIHLRVTDLDKKFIGLVLYGTNTKKRHQHRTCHYTCSTSQHSCSTLYLCYCCVATTGLAGTVDNHVGSWEIPAGAEFQVTPTCQNVVTHINANIKPLHTRFFFTAPKGTGTVTFKLLIKQGEQNTGFFYYPAKTLTLQEGASPATSAYPTIISLPGASCSSTCLKLTSTPYCHYTRTASTTTSSSLSVTTDNIGSNCRLPYIASCSSAAPFIADNSDFCTYRSCLTTTTPTPNVCTATNTADNAKRICVCSSSLADSTADGTTTSPSSTPTSSPTTTVKPTSATAASTSTPTGTSSTTTTKTPTGTSSTTTTKAPSSTPSSSPTATTTATVKPTSTPTSTPTGTGTGKVTTAPTSSSKPTSSSSSSPSTDTNNVKPTITVSAASSTASSSSTIIMTLFMSTTALLSSSRSSSFFIILLSSFFFFSSHVSCHNYIKSQHRARKAAVSVPCVARVTNQPHVQVIKDQEFTVEWSQGHGDYTQGPFYFAIVPISEFDRLKAKNITDIYKDYLAKAPSTSLLTGTKWQRRNLRKPTQTGVDTYFTSSALSPSDPLFIARDPIYAAKSEFGDRSDLIQTMPKDEYLIKDKRATYVSDIYPWLESVTVFYNPYVEHTFFNDQAGLARFSVPAIHGTGDYVIHFYWSGYKDCIDVNVVSGTTPVAKPYGQLTTTASTKMVRIDNCEFTNVPKPVTQCRVLDRTTLDASACLADCTASAACTGVQVVRAKNPVGTLQAFPNIPRTIFNSSFAGRLDNSPEYPCTYTTVNDRAERGCQSKVSSTMMCDGTNWLDDDYICYGLSPYRNENRQTVEDYTTAFEKSDPVYYSTCFFEIKDQGFVGIAPDVPEKPSWIAGDDCLSCDFVTKVNGLTTKQIPDWTKGFTNVCRACDNQAPK